MTSACELQFTATISDGAHAEHAAHSRFEVAVGAFVSNVPTSHVRRGLQPRSEERVGGRISYASSSQIVKDAHTLSVVAVLATVAYSSPSVQAVASVHTVSAAGKQAEVWY